MDASPSGRPAEPSLARDLLHLASGCLLGTVAAIAVTQWVGPGEEPDVARYREVRDFVRRSYVEPIDSEALLDDAGGRSTSSSRPGSRSTTTAGRSPR